MHLYLSLMTSADLLLTGMEGVTASSYREPMNKGRRVRPPTKAERNRNGARRFRPQDNWVPMKLKNSFRNLVLSAFSP